jgi:hypothetical protein
MEKTIPASNLDDRCVGYVVNSGFSADNQALLSEIQSNFANEFSGALWIPKTEALHITLMDWLAPLVSYGRDKDEIFPEIFNEYDNAVNESVEGTAPIHVEFGVINVSSDAIFLTGEDRGQYQTIRDRFLGKVSLLPNTKLPPKIIHSTIARFTKSLDIDVVRTFAQSQTVAFEQLIDVFKLLRSTDTKMEDYKIIKTYNLG